MEYNLTNVSQTYPILLAIKVEIRPSLISRKIIKNILQEVNLGRGKCKRCLSEKSLQSAITQMNN